MNMENKELNLNEMEEAAGGKGGSRKVLPKKDGFIVYQIATGDTLIRIAKRYKTTVEDIMAVNPTIKKANDITAGYWIYIPQ